MTQETQEMQGLTETAIRRDLNGDDLVTLYDAPVSLRGAYELLEDVAIRAIVDDCGYWVHTVGHTEDGAAQYVCARR